MYQNGFVIQHCHDFSNCAEEFVKTRGYRGLLSRFSDPLFCLKHDRESQELSDAACWIHVAADENYLLTFISNPDLLLRYIKCCRKQNVPIRLLFVESDYDLEQWTGPEVPKKMIGYEYNACPFDEEMLADFIWHPPFAPFHERLNEWGLFVTLEDAQQFKQAYDLAWKRGEVWDGLPYDDFIMQNHIFRLYEVEVDDVLRCLDNEANGPGDDSLS